MNIFWKKLASAAIAVSIAGAWSVGVKAQDQLSIIAVTHGQASDPFWSVVKNG